MKSERLKNSFLLQSAVLAIAAILGRIIGLIYRIPLTATLGDQGNNYYGSAFDIYYIAWLVSSYSFPVAVSRLVAEEKAKEGQVFAIVKTGLLFAGAVGLAASFLLGLLAPFITGRLLKTPNSLYSLYMLVPALTVSSLLGVLRGYFQGEKQMLCSGISQVLEQLVNAFVSVFAARLFSGYAQKGTEKSAAYGAAGASLGTVLGMLSSLVFLSAIAYSRFRSQPNGQARFPLRRMAERFFPAIAPMVAASLLFNINIVFEQGMFKHFSENWLSLEEISLQWGIFSGKFKTLINLAIASATAIGAACVPEITAASACGDKERVSEKSLLAFEYAMYFVIPLSFLFYFQARELMRILFQDQGSFASKMLQYGAILPVFYALATVGQSILQGIGKMKEAVWHSAIALGVELLCLVFCLKFTELRIYGLLVSMLAFSVTAMLLNQFALYRFGCLRGRFFKIFTKPALFGLLFLAVCNGIFDCF